MAKSNISLDEGKILYIEPNYSSSIERVSESGIQQYEMIQPMEDYSIYVNLEVEVRGRTVRVNGGSEMLTYVMTFESDQKGTAVNFMRGSKIPVGKHGSDGYINSLTTNYTNTFVSDVLKEKNDGFVDDPTLEMFGISSIDIAYKNYMVPEVTINFVDVRGISLFAQEEYRHNHPDGYSDETIAGSFFKCFFTFPYPKFTLIVKGFYGEPVSYELTCADFRAKFDSNTGNFGAVAKFVGYAFSFFGDISLRSILAAPYSDYIGSEYWSSKVASGEFFIYDENNNKIGMPRIGDFVKNIKEIINEAEKLSQSSPEVQEKTIIEDKTAKLTQLQNLYSAYSDVIKGFIRTRFGVIPTAETIPACISVTDQNSSDDLTDCILLLPIGDGTSKFVDFVEDTGGTISYAYEALKKSISEYNASYNASIPYPIDLSKATPYSIFVIDDKKLNLSANTQKRLTDYTDNSFKRLSLYNKVKEFLSNHRNKTLDKAGDNKNLCGYFFLDSGFGKPSFKSYLATESQNNADNLSKAVSQIDEAVDKAITRSLGYPPTVENITRIILAHFETFAYMVFKTGESICSDHSKRSLSSLGLSLDVIPDVSSPVGSIDFVPPFPKVIHRKKEFGEDIEEESWIGSYNGDFVERDLVNGLINGTIEFANLQNTDNVSGPAFIDKTLAKTTMSLPISPFDFVATKDIYRPLTSLNNCTELAARLAMRAFGLIGVSGVFANDPEKLGRLEAYNFYMTHQKPSGFLYSFIGDENVSDTLYNTVAKSIGKNDPPRPWGNNSFLISSSTSLLSLRNNSKGNPRVNNTAIPLQDIYANKDDKLVVNDIFHIPNFNTDSDYYISHGVLTGNSNVYKVELNPSKIASIIEYKLSIDDDDIEDLKELYDNAVIKEKNVKRCFKSTERILGDFEDPAHALIPKEGTRFFPSKPELSTACPKNTFSSGTDNFITSDNVKGAKRVDVDIDSFYSDLNSEKFTLSSFYGVILDKNNNAVPSKSFSLFGQSLYYEQCPVTALTGSNTDICWKAFLFLTSLGMIYKYDVIFEDYLFDVKNGKFNSETLMCILPHVSLLYAGSLVWRYGLDQGNPKEYPFNEVEYVCYARLDIRNRLKKEFIDWATTTYKTKIHDNLAIVDNITNYKLLTHPEGAASDGGSCFVDNNNYQVIDLFKKYCRHSFFENYLSVGSSRSFSNKCFNITLLNRPSGIGIYEATKEILSFCTFVKISNNAHDKAEVLIPASSFKSFLNGFSSKMKELYTKYAKDDKTNEQIDRAKDPGDVTNEDIRIALYRYCKILYDRWVGGLSSDDFQREWTVTRFFGDDTSYEKYFYFIDSYYSLAKDVFINVGEMCEMIQNCWADTNYTLLSFLSDLYARNKFQFFCIQNFLDFSNKDYLEKMFVPVPTNEMTMPKKIPNFIVMFASEPSTSLDVSDRHDFKNDSFLVSQSNNENGNKWPKALLSRYAGTAESESYRIPAFGVSYGKMYQSYFTNIDIGMDSPVVTEQSLRAQYQIAAEHNESGDSSPRSAKLMGQDLFTVYSNNSYTCNVDMMGCAWVQPLMYFCLNNVPMFRGTYLIENVQHHIEPGNMTTSFMGVRMSNVRTRKSSSWLERKKANRTGVQTTSDGPTVFELAADVNNNCPYRSYPILSSVNYGQDNYSDDLKGTVGQYNNGSDWGKLSKDSNLLDAITAVGIIEAGANGSKPTDGIYAIAAVMYNHKAHMGWAKGPLRAGNFSARNSNRVQEVYQSVVKGSYNEIREVFRDVFTNGSATISNYIKPKKIPSDPEWNPNKWGNNQLGKTSNTSYQLTPEEAAGLYFFCFKQEWAGTFKGETYYNTAKEKATQMCSYPNHTLLAFLANQYFCANPTAWEKQKQKMRQKPPKVLNDTSNKISEFAMGFYNAVQQTSNNSSVKVEFGVSNEKSKGTKLYLTNGKNASNFSGIFDIIVNTPEYYSHVKTLKWVTTENSFKKEPSAIVVEVSENEETKQKIGLSIDDGNTIMSKSTDYSNVNSAFCLTIAKKYANEGEAKTHVSVISNLPDMFKNQTILECSKVVSEATGMPVGELTGFEGQVTNSKMKKVLAHCDTICLQHNYSGPVYSVRKSGNKQYKPCPNGQCTYGPSTWYHYEGLDIRFGGGPSVRTHSNDGIKNYGFKLVWHGTVADSLKLSKDQFRPGDVATEYYIRTDGKASGHACMWTGKDWRSDFVQNTIMPNQKFTDRDGNYSVCIWRHPDFQEPGQKVVEVT